MADEREVVIKIKSEYDGKGEVDAKKGMKSIKEASQQTSSSVISGAKNATTGINNLGAAIGRVFAAFYAAKSIIGFFASSVTAANENARAVNTLAAAYQAVGYTANGAMKQAQEFATKMQNLTGIADEAFLNAQRLLANYGVVGTKAQEAIKAAYALSIGRNMEFSAAMDYVSKAAAGQTSALARHGIQIEKNTEEGKKFDAVLAQINEKFGATAQAAMGDMISRTNALKESWGDFKEQIGAGLNDGLAPVVDALAKSVSWLSQLFKSLSAGWSVTFDWLMTALQGIKAGFLTLGEYAVKSLQPAVNLMSHIPVVGGKIKNVFDDANNSLKQMASDARTQTVELARMSTPLSAILKTEKAITEETKEQLKLNEDEVNAKRKVGDESELEKARQKEITEELKRQRQVLNDAGVGPKQTTSGWDTSKYVTQEQTGLADILAGTNLNETSEFLKNIEEQKYGLEDLYKKKLELLEQGQLDEETFAAAKLELDTQYGAERAKLDEQLNKKRQQTMATALNNLASLQNSSNKKMAAVGKAAAIAQATIDTYKAANGAYSAMASIPYVGPALAVAAAAAAIAAGLNNVAQISGIQLAEGGLVKAVTGGVPAVVGEGGSDEAVLPLDNARAMQRIGGAIAEESGAVGNITLTQNITIQAGESLIPDITNALRNATVDALEMANLAVKVGNSQQGLSV